MTNVLKPKRIIDRLPMIFSQFNINTVFLSKISKEAIKTTKRCIKKVLISVCTIVVAFDVSAKPLDTDPAWTKQIFDNGFTLFSTQATQRPNDPIELRLVLSTGSLAESSEEKGALTTLFFSSVSKYNLNADRFYKRNQPLVTIGYDEVIISMEVKNNSSNESVKEAINLMYSLVEFDKQSISAESNNKINPMSMMGIKPTNPKDTFWLNRIHDSVLVGAEPSLTNQLLDTDKLAKFHSTWFTPDSMKLFVAGKIDNRVLSEEINKSFAKLSGSRTKNHPVAVLQPLRGGAILAPVNQGILVVTPVLDQPIVSLYWDSQWQPINSSRALEKWWEMELAREAIFSRVNKELGVENNEKLKLNIDCNVAFQRQLCGIGISYSESELLNKFQIFLNQLAMLEDKGITDEEFKKLISDKNDALANLFATYAKTDLSSLIDNKVQAEKNGIQDISLEDYQQLRQAYLSSLSKETINNAISKFLAKEATILIRESTDDDKLDPAVFLQKYQSSLLPNSANLSVNEDIQAHEDKNR